MAELQEIPNGVQVVNNDNIIGTICNKQPDLYEWQSRLSKPPFHQGKSKTETGALAHIGFKFRDFKFKRKGSK